MQVASSLQRQGTRIGMAHTIEVLDASIRGLPVDTLTADGTSEKPGRPRRRLRRAASSTSG
jgi:hypothetical protein